MIINSYIVDTRKSSNTRSTKNAVCSIFNFSKKIQCIVLGLYSDALDSEYNV